MNYLICQDWRSTSGNHAGIRYLCQELEKRYPDLYTVFCCPNFGSSGKLTLWRRLINFVLVKWGSYLYRRRLLCLLKRRLSDGDKVFLLEYLAHNYTQLPIAQTVKSKFPFVSIYAMVHLVPQLYDRYFSDRELVRWTKPIDGYITLGHSLTEYLIRRGIPKDMVYTSFHYVDSTYYKPNSFDLQKQLTVIAMGNMKRNYSLLRQIVIDNPQVRFIICQGRNNLSMQFEGIGNVELVPFVPEEKLRFLMGQADVSLNSMDDTVGSNVIVTSMAMGLAMICSNVGSIGDYCGEDNAIFCDNADPTSFTIAIRQLRSNPKKLLSMRKASRRRAEQFSIESFHDWLCNNL